MQDASRKEEPKRTTISDYDMSAYVAAYGLEMLCLEVFMKKWKENNKKDELE